MAFTYARARERERVVGKREMFFFNFVPVPLFFSVWGCFLISFVGKF